MFDGGGAICAEGAKGIMTKLHRGTYNNNMQRYNNNIICIIYIIINLLPKALPQLHVALEFLSNVKRKLYFCNASFRFELLYIILS